MDLQDDPIRLRSGRAGLRCAMGKKDYYEIREGRETVRYGNISTTATLECLRLRKGSGEGVR